MTNVPAEKIEQSLAELLQETRQAHFLHALTGPEALVVLRERHNQLQLLRQLARETEHSPCAAVILDHLHVLLATELAWVEQAIALLQESESYLETGMERLG